MLVDCGEAGFYNFAGTLDFFLDPDDPLDKVKLTLTAQIFDPFGQVAL